MKLFFTTQLYWFWVNDISRLNGGINPFWISNNFARFFNKTRNISFLSRKKSCRMFYASESVNWIVGNKFRTARHVLWNRHKFLTPSLSGDLLVSDWSNRQRDYALTLCVQSIQFLLFHFVKTERVKLANRRAAGANNNVSDATWLSSVLQMAREFNRHAAGRAFWFRQFENIVRLFAHFLIAKKCLV